MKTIVLCIAMGIFFSAINYGNVMLIYNPEFHLFPALISCPKTPEKIRQSSNKFRKYSDLNNLLDLRTIVKCGTLLIRDLLTQSFSWIADL
jgi:hypothetical protein